MKKIFRIARLELSIMFYSPIAWLVLIILIIQTGLTFTELLYNNETSQQLGRPLSVLSKVLFAGEHGIFTIVQQNLYLYIPLLTMGLFSRETGSGSIKLLLSSPVTVTQIVLGKFLSMIIYAFILALVLLSFTIPGGLSIEALDVKFVAGGVLGLYLLICAYSAIGLFMSSLTTYQVVAAISTLAILAALNFVGQVGQTYDFVRDITFWLSISGRADNFVNGLISSKDFIYFIIVIGLFVGLTIMKLDNERHTRSKLLKAGRYSLLIISFVVIGYMSSLPTINLYYDSTRFLDRTLTATSQDIVKQLDKPVSITSYINVVDYTASYGAPKNRISDQARFEKYRRFIPSLKMDYVFYYDTLPRYNDTTKTLIEKAQRAASAHKFNFENLLAPEEMKKKIDLLPEDNKFVRYIDYGGKKTPLRMFDDIFVYPGEAEITAALKRMVSEPALAGVLSGNGERSTEKLGDGSYKFITKGLGVRGSLINQGFDVVNVAIDDVEEIPANLDVLVLADPKEAYSSAQVQKIEAYLNAGGNILIAGEPGRQSHLNPILQKLGVSFLPGSLLQESENFELDLITTKFTNEAKALGFSYYDQAVVSLPGAMQIQFAGSGPYVVTPLLATDSATTWRKIGEFDLNLEKVVFNPETETKVTAAVALALTRKLAEKEQKIIVLGDADFMSNAELNRNNIQTVNGSFAIRMFKWFSGGEYPVEIVRPKAIDDKILLSRTGIQWLKSSIVGVIPVLIGLFGLTLLIRRKGQ